MHSKPAASDLGDNGSQRRHPLDPALPLWEGRNCVGSFGEGLQRSGWQSPLPEAPEALRPSRKGRAGRRCNNSRWTFILTGSGR